MDEKQARGRLADEQPLVDLTSYEAVRQEKSWLFRWADEDFPPMGSSSWRVLDDGSVVRRGAMDLLRDA